MPAPEGVMDLKTKSKKTLTPEEQEAVYTRDFLDQICPGDIRFYTDHFICGSTFRSVWAVREYPPTTEEQAILRHLGEKSGVTLRIYARFVTALEQRKIIQNAARKNLLKRGNTQDMQENVIAESNLQDVANLLASTHRNKEPLLHTAIFAELVAPTLDALRELQAHVEMELTRSKINVDKLLLRQKEGFLSVMPCGYNVFGVQFERVLPASSAANLYPLCYSGRTDPQGFPIGKDKCGTHIIVDFMRRESDKTNSNILILGNSGQGKSFLIKLISTILREGNKNLIILDAEDEYIDLTRELGGCHIDLMSGQYLINVLEPRVWGSDEEDGAPVKGVLSEHISFLREFFASYKDFTDRHLDTLEILLQRLYRLFGISDQTDVAAMSPERFPILKDLYDLLEKEFMEFDGSKKHLYTEELLQDLCLGLHSICVGTDSKYFNGHTNISSGRVLCFGVKGAMEAGESLKNVLLFNVLSYMSGALLGDGNTIAVLDELYLWLSNIPAVVRIRNAMKRVRKKDSAILIASQNLDDYMQPEIAELTKPLFAIPSHTFLFNPGTVDKKFYIENLQLEPSEYELIKLPQQGLCLYKCGNQRYHLEVQAPDYKEERFGKAGGV
jgi:type IV secretory pathway VirB4 component